MEILIYVLCFKYVIADIKEEAIAHWFVGYKCFSCYDFNGKTTIGNWMGKRTRVEGRMHSQGMIKGN